MRINPKAPLFVFLPPRPWKIDLAKGVKSNLESHDFPNNTFNHLQNLGVKVEILIPYFTKFSFFRRLNPFILGLDFLRALRVLIFYRNATCIISIVESGGFFILLLRKLFMFKPKILLWDLSAGNEWRVVKIIQKITLPRYDGFMLLTSSQINYLIRYGYTAKKSLIYYNVDESFLDSKLSNDGDYILSVGDDNSRDYATLVRALDGISCKTIIKSLLDISLNENNNIEILTENLSSEIYRDLIANAKLVVIPLFKVDHAGGITFLLEAMSLGKPIVITESSISNDFLLSNSACVVPVGDFQSMSYAINQLLNNNELRAQCSLKVREIVEKNYTTRKLAERMKNFCLEIANE